MIDRILPLLIVIAVVALFALIVFAMIRANRRHTEKRAELAAAFGFTPVQHPGRDLLERIASLQPRRGVPLELRNVFSKVTADGTLYLFDLWNTSGDDDSVMQEKAFALVVPGLNLPRFSLFPRIEIPGKLAGLANRVIDWAVSQSGERISFEENPAFIEHYIITGEDETAVRQALNSALCNRLIQFDNIVFQVGGDTLCASRQVARLAAGQDENSAFAEWFRQAQSALRLFIEL